MKHRDGWPVAISGLPRPDLAGGITLALTGRHPVGTHPDARSVNGLVESIQLF
ncbi:hypothetical protein Q8G38_16210 [Halomonas venusta]|uniref:hypothetical protein n=1 Tax=Vreelandella venusta TaxID=44935 RepID=UPI00295E2F9C|nr:hypothetical protein [Halomonas venusta]MDW0360858.1 hypothetical protein [Halomonas venusta]